MSTITIEELEKLTVAEAKEKIEWKQHVSVKDQLAMAKLLAESLVSKNKDDIYVVDKNEQEILSYVAYVSLSTNIELGEDDYHNYDVLTGIVNPYEFELLGFQDYVENYVNSLLEQNNIEYVAARAINEVVFNVSTVVDHLNDMLDKGDPNKIAKYLSKSVEMLAKKMPDFSAMDSKQMIETIKKV